MILLQKRKQKIIELVTRPGLEQVYRVPKYVAGVLELPQSERYTGLSFAGTSLRLGTLPEPADISDMSESEPEPEDPEIDQPTQTDPKRRGRPRLTPAMNKKLDTGWADSTPWDDADEAETKPLRPKNNKAFEVRRKLKPKKIRIRKSQSNLKVEDFPDFGYLSENDIKKYQDVWDSFCQTESLEGEAVPEEWQFLSFFQTTFDQEDLTDRVAKMNESYAVLDALTMVFYGFGLGKWPKIKEYIQCCNQDDVKIEAPGLVSSSNFSVSLL